MGHGQTMPGEIQVEKEYDLSTFLRQIFKLFIRAGGFLRELDM